MSKSKLCILQVSTYEIGGGAEKIAWDLFHSYRDRGYLSYLAVGLKKTDDKNVLQIPNDGNRSSWSRFWIASDKFMNPLVRKTPVIGRHFSKLLTLIGQPYRRYRRLQGYEDFDYPATWNIPNLTPYTPDIIHCHNLHGNYFDLRALQLFSHRFPLVLTLHDAWLLSGNCAHSFECERWSTGCGNCPDITIYPGIKKDKTRNNWKRKKEIFENSCFFVVTPSKWLMEKVNKSIMTPAIIDSKVIPNGVDLRVFHPFDQSKAREELGLPNEDKILLFAANVIRTNIWKDYKTLKTAIEELSETFDEKILFLAIGEAAPSEQIGKSKIQFVPFQREAYKVALYYQAADLYVQPSKVDTFPNTVLEALACGTPVVATKVGGIPEQIEDGKTGFLVPPGNGKLMADRIASLLKNDNLRKKMSEKASESAHNRFGLNRQVNEYLDFYEHMIESYNNKFISK